MSLTTPVFAADVTIVPTPNLITTETTNMTVQPRSTSYEVTGNYVSFRAQPSLSGDVVAYLMKGDIVADLKDSVYADGHTWINVQCVNCSESILNGTPGWVASDYLNIIG